MTQPHLEEPHWRPPAPGVSIPGDPLPPWPPPTPDGPLGLATAVPVLVSDAPRTAESMEGQEFGGIPGANPPTPPATVPQIPLAARL